MTQKRWKLSITELGSTKVLAETVVEAGDWMTGLSRARTQIGERAGVPQGASVSVAPDGKVSILDAVGRRQYTLIQTIESLPAPKVASVPPPPPPASTKKPDFKKTMAYVPAAAPLKPIEKAVGVEPAVAAAPVATPAAVAAAPVAAALVAAAPVAAAPVAAAVVATPVAAAPVAAASVAAASVAAAPVATPVAAAPVAAAVVAPPIAAVAVPPPASTSASGSSPSRKMSRATVAYMPSPLAAVTPPVTPVGTPATPAIGAPAISTPAADPPAISAPAIGAPAISAPAISTPAADPPAISAPAISAPAISAPAISAPEVVSATPDDLELLFARDSEPSKESPLVYRERNWLVAEDLDADEAELLLRTRFSALREELSARPKGKLVKLALFDHRWTGQPQRPPILVLTWKDWRGEPEVIAKGRLSTPGAVQQPSVPPSAMPSAPPPAMPSAPPPAISAPEPAIVAPASPAPIAPRPSLPEPEASIIIDAGLRSEEAALLADPAQTLEDVPAMRGTVPSPPPTVSASTPRSAAVAPATPSAPPPRRTDDRLASAFEALQDLFFLPTQADGADFVLRLLGELIPAEAASIALYDINTDEMRFVAASGVGGDERKGDAVPSQAGILGGAVHGSGNCVVVSDVTADRRFDPGIDGRVGLEATNLAVMPVAAQGRLLGAIQLLNRIGDLEFSHADGNLLAYIAQRFGEFLHQHKVAEPRRVSQSAPGRTLPGRR